MGESGREFSLKVDNLPLHADKFQLREAFRSFGEVGDVYIPRDRAYGFVRFRNHHEAEAAQEAMDGAEVCGRTVRVAFAKEPETSKRRAIGEADEAGGPQPKRGRGVPGPYIFKALGSEHVVAALIGKGGATLRELQEETGARVDFSGRGTHFPETRCRVITVRADTPQAVAHMLDVIVDHIQDAATNLDDDPSKGRFPGDCRVVALVARFVAGSLLGKGGEDMRRLQAELQCYIEVEKSPLVEGHQRVEIRGECEEVKRALRVVNEKVEAEVHRDWFPGWAAQDPLAGISSSIGGSAGRGERRDASRSRGRPHAMQDDPEMPSADDLVSFRERYPVDERAWQYFTSSSGAIQAKVLQDFRPKPLREGDEDFSALLTSFVASVAKRFADNPSGFRKGLGAGGRDAEEEWPTSRDAAFADRPISRDTTAFSETLADIPLAYLGYDYAICCDLPVDRCRPIRRCMGEVGRATQTHIDLFGGEADGTQRLHITGRLPDVYTAHLRLMWAFNGGEQKPDPELQKMQDQIAELQAQLDAVKQGAVRRGSDRGGKRRNGRR